MWRKTAVFGIVTGLIIISLLLSGCLCSALLGSLLDDSGKTNPATSSPGSKTPASASTASSEAVYLPESEEPLLITWPPKGTPPDPELRVPKTGQLALGTPVSLGSQDIPPTGGTFILNKSGDPLNGLTLTVSSGSYEKTRTFRITSAPISNCTFRDVTPITPLITIDNGGDYAASIMTLKIPVKVKPGQFAMGFIYDAKTGRLEGLPLAAKDENSITIATRHFSDVFVSLFDQLVLSGDIKTGFMPSWDDWEFPNWGSYIEPGGHCAGQSITALWYYTEKPDGRATDIYLNNRYDNNGEKPLSPNFWYDDSRAYRLASVVQHDINWDSLANTLMYTLGGLNDELTWQSFASTMKATGEPQYVGIRSSDGGHAMVCYRIVDRTLYIADPNYPGKTDRRIEWNKATGSFKPYNSAANARDIADGKGTEYKTIRYVAKSAMIPWSKVAARWSEMKAGTIGDGIFPAYKIKFVDTITNTWVEAKEGLVVTWPLLKIQPQTTAFKSGSAVYRDGKRLIRDNQNRYTLLEGANQLGIYAVGEVEREVKTADNRTELKKYWEYVDFRNVTVNYFPLSIDPKSAILYTGDTGVFTASIKGKVPGLTWSWQVDGDDSPESTAVFRHAFGNPGTYDVTAIAWDVSGRELGEVTCEVTVRPRPTTALPKPTSATPATSKLDRLHALLSLKFNLECTGTYTTVSGGGQPYPHSAESQVFKGPTMRLPITWNGTSFSAKGTWQGSDVTESVTGTVSSDASRVVSLTYEQNSKDKGVMRVVLTDIPLDWPPPPPGYDFSIESTTSGSAVQGKVSALEFVTVDYALRNGLRVEDYRWTYGKTDWSKPATLKFGFYHL